MTIVRAIDNAHDWLFGKGLNDYASANNAVAQNINTRLNSYLNNCFFDTAAGIDWFNLLGSKNQIAISLAISGCILNTENVVQLLQLQIGLNSLTRNFLARYQVQTTFSTFSSTFTPTINPGTPT